MRTTTTYAPGPGFLLGLPDVEELPRRDGAEHHEDGEDDEEAVDIQTVMHRRRPRVI